MNPHNAAGLRALRGERDAEMFAFQVLALGRAAKARGEDADALLILQSLHADAVPEAMRAGAAREADALLGRGSGAGRAEYLLPRFAREAADPKMILPMIAGTGVGSALQAAAALRWGPAAGRVLGFAGEVGAFTLSARTLQAAAGTAPGPWERDLLSASLGLGLFRLFGAAGRKAVLRFHAADDAGRATRFARAAGWTQAFAQHGGQLGGLWTAHALEEHWGLRPKVAGATFFLDGLAAWAGMNVGSRLGAGLLGPRFLEFSRELGLRRAAPPRLPFAFLPESSRWRAALPAGLAVLLAPELAHAASLTGGSADSPWGALGLAVGLPLVLGVGLIRKPPGEPATRTTNSFWREWDGKDAKVLTTTALALPMVACVFAVAPLSHAILLTALVSFVAKHAVGLVLQRRDRLARWLEPNENGAPLLLPSGAEDGPYRQVARENLTRTEQGRARELRLALADIFQPLSERLDAFRQYAEILDRLPENDPEFRSGVRALIRFLVNPRTGITGGIDSQMEPNVDARVEVLDALQGILESIPGDVGLQGEYLAGLRATIQNPRLPTDWFSLVHYGIASQRDKVATWRFNDIMRAESLDEQRLRLSAMQAYRKAMTWTRWPKEAANTLRWLRSRPLLKLAGKDDQFAWELVLLHKIISHRMSDFNEFNGDPRLQEEIAATLDAFRKFFGERKNLAWHDAREAEFLNPMSSPEFEEWSRKELSDELGPPVPGLPIRVAEGSAPVPAPAPLFLEWPVSDPAAEASEIFEEDEEFPSEDRKMALESGRVR